MIRRSTPLLAFLLLCCATALHPADPRARAASDEMERLYKTGDLAGAESHARLWMAILGPDSPDLPEPLGSLAAILAAAGRPADGLPYAERALEIRRRTGTNVDTAALDLARLQMMLGNAERAATAFSEAVTVREKRLPATDPDLARARSELAHALQKLGKLDEAAKLCQLAAGCPGLPAGEAAVALTTLGLIELGAGRVPAARAALERALALLDETRSPDARSVANTLAKLLEAAGDHAAARPLLDRLTAESPRNPEVLSRLGRCLSRLNDPAGARRSFEAALACGPPSPDLEHDLAGALETLGDLPGAAVRLRSAEATLKSSAAANRFVLATVQTSLARVLRRQGNLEAAEAAIAGAIEAVRAAGGERHARLAGLLGTRGLLQLQRGQPREARKTLEQALAVARDSSAEAALIELHLSHVLEAEGNLQDAARSMERALGQLAGAMGEDHPDVLDCRADLAMLRWRLGDAAAARAIARHSFEAVATRLERLLPALSEAERLVLISKQRAHLDLLLSSTAGAEVYSRALRWKQLAWQAVTAAREAAGPSSLPAADRLRKCTLELSAAFADPAAQPDSLERLTAEKERLERELGASAPPLASTTALPEIPVGWALVDILQRYQLAPGRQPEPWLTAFVLRRGAQPARIELGPARAIRQAVEAWRVLVGTRAIPLAVLEASGRRVASVAWTPLTSAIGDCRTVIVCPEGILGRLPLGALPGPDAGTYLAETFTFARVVSVADLQRSTPPAAATEKLLCAGGIDYGGPSLAPLAGAREEAEAVVAIHGDAFPGSRSTLLTGADATRESLERALKESRWVHLATHGLWTASADEQVFDALIEPARPAAAPGERGTGAVPPSSTNAGRPQGEPAPGAGAGRSPLLFSALALSGAAQGPRGRLSGADALWLDLERVELVTLSACQLASSVTVMPDAAALGMTQALLAAGAGQVVSALWPVSDAATVALMRAFYRRLWFQRRPALEALAGAQREAIAEARAAGGTARPVDWAGFVLTMGRR